MTIYKSILILYILKLFLCTPNHNLSFNFSALWLLVMASITNTNTNITFIANVCKYLFLRGGYQVKVYHFKTRNKKEIEASIHTPWDFSAESLKLFPGLNLKGKEDIWLCCKCYCKRYLYLTSLSLETLKPEIFPGERIYK